MTRPAPGWRPLPECSSCRRPTKRATWDRLGGLCSICRATEHPAMTAERAELHDWQATVARIRRQERQDALQRADRLRARREAREARQGGSDGQL